LIDGSWRVAAAASTGEYLDFVSARDEAAPWFLRPNRTSDRVVLQTPKGGAPNSTFGGLRIETRLQRGRRGGSLDVSATCNPTRTLAHLLSRFPNDETFRNVVGSLEAVEFFGSADDVPRSLDGNDNFISDYDAARRALGRDIFSAFLPIYFQKFQTVIARFVAPDLDTTVTDEGGAAVISSHDGEVRLDWHEARAGQVEGYFERFHSQAVQMVRNAGQTLLAGADVASIRQHFRNVSYERDGDLFSITIPLPNEAQAACYAKLADRLRFEVRRSARRYSEVVRRATQRPLAIANLERENVVHAGRWSAFGELLTEHDLPILGDLLQLVSRVVEACLDAGSDPIPVLSSILTDGGLIGSDENSEVVASLERSGVLSRFTVRRRDRALPRRYMLTADYRQAYDTVISAFSTETRD
jgi:hypothetical protein